jgi:ABC-2 type transport system ATP-binding protein
MSAPALALHDVHKRFGNAVALDGLSFEIARGEVYGLLGPNGAGKTTALRVICGVLGSDRGSCLCLGEAPGIARGRLGYVPQAGALYADLSVTENLVFFARAHGLPDVPGTVAAALARHQLAGRADQRVAQLSGGWRQRVALAAALLHAPRLLLLDEPTAGLDALASEALWQSLRELVAEGLAVLITTHHADEAARCDRIGYLRKGRLQVEGQPAQIAARLGLSAWRYPPIPHAPVLAADWCCTRDAGGWRVIGRGGTTDLPPAIAAGCTADTATLGDALAWLARQQASE